MYQDNLEQAPQGPNETEETYVELLDGRSATFVGSNHLHLHDLDWVSASTMAGTHIPIWAHTKKYIKKKKV